MTLSGPELPPASGGEAKQLVILLHGLGSDGNDLIGLAPEYVPDLPDAHFISPDAPFPCDMAPFGYQWFSLQDRDPAIVLEGVRTAEPILNAFIDEQLTRFNLTDENLALIGFSQGTMMSLHTALRRPNPCAGILGYSGALTGPETLSDELQSKPPICLVHGEMDMVVPFDAMAEAETALKATDIPIETHARPMLGHGVDPEGVAIGKAFLKRIFS